MIGRIYKIYSPQLEICYIGSTCNTTRDRFMQHKNSYKQWLNNNHSEIAIFPYFKQLGLDSFRCVPIIEYQVCDKYHLRALEQLWINKFKKTAVNKACSFSIPIDNKYKKKDINKLYYDANKDVFRNKTKLYREANVDKVKKYHSEYKDKNADKLKEKFNCECGGKYQKQHKSIHQKTKKHQSWLATN